MGFGADNSYESPGYQRKTGTNNGLQTIVSSSFPLVARALVRVIGTKPHWSQVSQVHLGNREPSTPTPYDAYLRAGGHLLRYGAGGAGPWNTTLVWQRLNQWESEFELVSQTA